MPPDVAFASVNGTRLAYRRRGAGPAALFIHGATLDHRMWRPQFASLSDHLDLVAYDLRSCGASAAPEGRFAHWQDAAALIEHLGIAPAVVVAHSIGGLYALELAVARPDLVRGVATLGMSGLGDPPFTEDIRAMLGAVRHAARTEGLAAAKAIWAGCGWFRSARAVPEVAALLDEILADHGGWGWLNDSPAVNLDPPVRARLGEITAPALIVDGGLDLDYNHATAESLARGIPRATLLRLPGAGHMANLEDPASVDRALTELAARAMCVADGER